jgi:hypothetical protein
VQIPTFVFLSSCCFIWTVTIATKVETKIYFSPKIIHFGKERRIGSEWMWAALLRSYAISEQKKKKI